MVRVISIILVWEWRASTAWTRSLWARCHSRDPQRLRGSGTARPVVGAVHLPRIRGLPVGAHSVDVVRTRESIVRSTARTGYCNFNPDLVACDRLAPSQVANRNFDVNNPGESGCGSRP